VVVVRRKVVTHKTTYIVRVLSEPKALRYLLKVVDVGKRPRKLLLGVQLQNLLFQFLHRLQKLLLQVIDSNAKVPLLLLHEKLLPRCDPQVVNRELIQLTPVPLRDLLCRI
jgi:hypothetical protein